MENSSAAALELAKKTDIELLKILSFLVKDYEPGSIEIVWRELRSRGLSEENVRLHRSGVIGTSKGETKCGNCTGELELENEEMIDGHYRCPLCKMEVSIDWATIESLSEPYDSHLKEALRTIPGSWSKWIKSKRVLKYDLPAEPYLSGTKQKVSIPRETYSHPEDPSSLTSFLVAMLWISLSVEVVSVVSDFAQKELLAQSSVSLAAIESNDTRQQLISILDLTVFIVTGIIFLRWVYKANLNSWRFGARDMKFTPRWSVGWYFIPLLNLALPYQAMEEIWKVSKDPAYWNLQRGTTLLGGWWALWLISNFLGYLSFRIYMKADTAESLVTITAISILSSFANISLCIITIKLVKAICENQQRFILQTDKKSMQES